METNLKHTVAALVLLILALLGCQQRETFYNNVQRSDVFFQAYDDHRYDFLWVFDNSGSMKPRRDFVRDNMRNFVSILNSRKAIDYQMAIVTTDYFADEGALVKSTGGLEVVKSTASDPAGEFSAIVDNISSTASSFWEQGLLSAKDAIFKHSSRFSRNGVPLIVIFLTDEEDWSCKDNCFGEQPETNTEWIPYSVDYFANFFQNVKKSENTDVFLFPIVGTSAENCDIASLGTRYMKLADIIGGISKSSSICDADLRDSFEGVARVIADRGVKFRLNNDASGKGIKVFVNQQLVPFTPENYIFDVEENAIVFTGAVPKNGDIVEVTYLQDIK